MNIPTRTIVVALALVAAAVLAWIIASRIDGETGRAGRAGEPMPIAVEIAPVEHRPMTWTRTFSGTLEARDRFVVAPKIVARVKRLSVDIGDTVQRGRLVCELDNEEYVQDLAQAQADLTVANANLTEAENALIIANREMDRVRTLSRRGITSDAQLDAAKTVQLEKSSRLEVAKAQVTRAEASVESARIRLGYTRVTAEWMGDDDERVVAERFVDEGDTVSATDALLSIVNLDPLTGVIFITEKDYARLTVGQTVRLSTDAYQGEHFDGIVARIAPVFRRETRQARVEIRVPNPDHRLKPGMFIRADVVLDHRDDAGVIPEAALTVRQGETGVFVLQADSRHVAWQTVAVGIRQGDVVAVSGLDAGSFVVTLGQQMLSDGSAVTIPEQASDQGSEAL
ncbi:efflux RND transporter periplasmic adaptor subunit [Desulfatiferula olefinivorans]